jgi:prophage antirepressor-like protein
MNTLASTSSLVPFEFEGRQIRVITDEQGEPWFVAADVCSTLCIGNVSQALSRLDGDEKTLISNEGSPAGGPQSLNLINEPGLYTLVLGSRKPEAKRFKRWVTHEVLPAILRSLQKNQPTGQFSTTMS